MVPTSTTTPHAAGNHATITHSCGWTEPVHPNLLQAQHATLKLFCQCRHAVQKPRLHVCTPRLTPDTPNTQRMAMSHSQNVQLHTAWQQIQVNVFLVFYALHAFCNAAQAGLPFRYVLLACLQHAVISLVDTRISNKQQMSHNKTTTRVGAVAD